MSRLLMSRLLTELMNSLQCLPGVGPKSAQRMAFFLLEREREGGLVLAKALQEAIAKVGHCSLCRTLSEDPLCHLCQSDNRDKAILCVVETPADLLAFEQAGCFRGLYFVLMGHLSPLDGIGPEAIGIPILRERLAMGNITEVILATNPTIEGEATAFYLSELIKEMGIHVTRIAYGVPFGGELEYLDKGTLMKALVARTPMLDTQKV